MRSILALVGGSIMIACRDGSARGSTDVNAKPIGAIVFGLLWAAILLAASSSASAAAADKLDRGPKAGEAIPHRLVAKDQNSKPRRFRTVAGKRGLILLFTRSLDW